MKIFPLENNPLYGNCPMRYVEVEKAPTDAIWLFSLYTYVPLTFHFMAPPTLHPYRSACGIGIASKNYLKWRAIQLAIHTTACV